MFVSASVSPSTYAPAEQLLVIRLLGGARSSPISLLSLAGRGCGGSAGPVVHCHGGRAKGKRNEESARIHCQPWSQLVAQYLEGLEAI